MKSAASFSDLTARTLSAVVMVLIGFGAIWLGGSAFLILVLVATGLMGWELTKMHDMKTPASLAFSICLAFCVFAFFGLPFAFAATGVVLLLGVSIAAYRRIHNTISLGAALIVLGALGLLYLRLNNGLGWTIWLVLCVVATDIGGYFAGKLIGGPKLWIAISPKKTWSGTLAGWILAAIVGLVGLLVGFGGPMLPLYSVLISIASQTGDLIESAAKRRAGVKDSSNLIPGHGGLLDRFDGFLGAGLAFFLISVAVG